MSFYLFRKMIRKLLGVVIKAVPKPEPVVIYGFGSGEKIGEICAAAGYQSGLRDEIRKRGNGYGLYTGENTENRCKTEKLL